MKPSLSCALLTIVSCALFPNTPVQAAYNPAIVAADARWVVYADFDALRTSTLGKQLVDAIERTQSRAGEGIIGVDIPKVLTTVGSVTAYGANLSKDPEALDGTLIAQGTADLRKIVESILLQGTLAQPEVFNEVNDLPFPAYSIKDSKAPESAGKQLIVAFPPEPIVLVSKSRAQLVKARDVFRGAAPSLAKAGTSALTPPAVKTAGAYLFATTVVPTEPLFPQNAPQTRILQLANSGAIAFGESGPNLFAQAELVASSGRNADKLMKILEGMTAMLSLAETNDRQLGEFLNSTSITREEDTITLRLAYPSERLVQMAQSFRKPAAARQPSREPPITHGRLIGEWESGDIDAPQDSAADTLSWRTLENVSLVNGSTITLGRRPSGKNGRFDRVEIVPTEGGSPLVFRSEFMRSFRGTMAQFQFPGSDGDYTLKVAYTNDPERKTTFAVSVSDPKPPEPPAPPAPAGR